MNSFIIHIPKWFQSIFSGVTWSVSTDKKELFLTFDDGPTPEITEWVLEELNKFNAKATFFCIGKNIAAHPEIFEKIIRDGHRIGNHTYNHLKGWKTRTKNYLNNTEKTQVLLDRFTSPENTRLFRPPYGKISPLQVRKLKALNYKIVLWSVLSGDFDPNISQEQCTENVIKNSEKGAVIVFHDSLKACQNMKEALPKVLAYFSKKGFEFNVLP